jgi:FkbM family methyltransferase
MDCSAPWGTHRPSAGERVWLSVCHAVQRVGAAATLALLLRRPLKYGSDSPLDVELWGMRLRLARRDSVSESRMLFTPLLFDRTERMAVLQQLQPGGVFIDLGANVGGYSFWVYHHFHDDVQILAVEADPDLAARIRFNCATNDTESIRVAQVALSDASGHGTLVIDRVNRGESFLTGADEIGVPVRTQPLLEVMRQHEIHHIDVLKIDIEGMEYRVLAHFFDHAERSLWPRSILFEMKDSPDHHRLCDRLTGLGYRVTLETARNTMVERRAG